MNFYSKNPSNMIDNGDVFIRFINGVYSTEDPKEIEVLRKCGYSEKPIISTKTNSERDLKVLILQLQKSVRDLRTTIEMKDSDIAGLEKKVKSSLAKIKKLEDENKTFKEK